MNINIQMQIQRWNDCCTVCQKVVYLQVIKMLIVVVVLFLLCWGPTIVMDTCKGVGLKQFNQVSVLYRGYEAVMVCLRKLQITLIPGSRGWS